MKTKFKSPQMIAGLATLLFFASLFVAGYFMRTNVSLRGGLDDERLRSENLLSEKLAVSKEVEQLKADITSWKGKSAKTDEKLENAMARAMRMENDIRNLRNQNAGIPQMTQELQELRKIRADLEKVIAIMDDEKIMNERRIRELTAEVASLQSELAETNIQIIPFNLTDNFKVESRRGRNTLRPTVIASRSRQLAVEFDVPESMANYLSFEIITPGGNIINSDYGAIAHAIIDDGRNLIADVSPVSGDFELTRRVKMMYKPERRLETGIYTIDILYNGQPAGRSQLRLR